MMDALEGITVLDLCRGYPPAFASMFLADFGANVIRIDTTGRTENIFADAGPEKWSACHSLDRGKKSIALNLKNNQGREIFLKLARNADVIIENSKPGTMDRLDIGYETIKNINSGIIYCSVSGYGKDGPYKDIPGHGSSYEGIAGVLSLFGQKNGPPSSTGPFIADMGGAACHSLIGILIALLVKQRTSKGQFIDVSYLDSVLSLSHFEISIYQATGEIPQRGDTYRTGGEPFSTQYQTKDGEYFSLAAVEPRFWANLLREFGREDYIAYHWTKDQQKKQEIFSWLREIFLTKTKDEWWEWIKDKDIAAGPVNNLEEGMNDPQVLHRKMILELEHPRAGKVKQVGIGVKLSETPGRFRSFAPLHSQHTVEILQGLGYTTEQIDKLIESGSVG